MKHNFTNHLINDRLDRVTDILTTVGVGEILYKFQEFNQYGPNLHCITNTGVLIIKSADDNCIITMFMLTERRLFAYWKAHQNNPHIPQVLLNTVRNNEKKRKYLFT